MRIGNTTVSVSRFGKATVNVMYYGAKVAWQAIRSCFGNGMWNGEKPWLGADAWKNKN
jgi:hypothetical protein